MTISDIGKRLRAMGVDSLSIEWAPRTQEWQTSSENGVIGCGETVDQSLERFVAASEGQARWNARMKEKLGR